MKFKLDASNIAKQKTDCVIIGIFENGDLTPSAHALNKISKGFLQNLIKNGEFQGKSGQTLLLYAVPHVRFQRVLLVGCGKNAPLTARDYRKLMHASINALSNTKVAHVATFLTELEVEKYEFPWKIKHAVEVIRAATYRFDRFKSKKEPSLHLKEIILYSPEDKATKVALKQGLAIADGVEYTKNLANLPSNICTPTFVATEAKTLVKEHPALSIKVLEEKDMRKLGMNALLAVAKGSAQNPKLVCIEYHGGPKKEAPIAFVGKGITFDTGGISLKPADSMIGMKYDMCGAATVLGVLKTAAELKLPLNIVGVLALAENMPSGTACKPEDIVVTMSGQTVEIMNTDAEGRLVLSDALTYVERFKPDTVIDIATLTGAVVVALGFHVSGMLSNHQPLAEDLLAAGQESHDRIWQLPLWDEYQDQIKSPFADMSNVGGRSAGTITAACFLSRFAKKFRWAHLDVAGTAAMMAGGNDRYATGRPVPLLIQYLIQRAEQKDA